MANEPSKKRSGRFAEVLFHPSELPNTKKELCELQNSPPSTEYDINLSGG